MPRRNAIREKVASLMLIVFVWLVTGTLVNFHQHHLYGKVLIFQVSSSLTLKKENQHWQKQCPKDVSLDGGGLAVLPALATAQMLISADPVRFAESPLQAVRKELSGILKLRGPPAC
jgi:hypothetical protein